MNQPKRPGLPPKIYVPIVLTVGLAVLAVVAVFLKSALVTTGGALAPETQVTGEAAANAADAGMPSGEVTIPQSGGSDARGVTAAQGTMGGGPPPAVAQMLGSLKARVAKNPGDLGAIVGLASMYFDAGKFDEAIPYYARALALDPSNPDTRTDYATALHGAGRDLEALAQLQKVLDEKPGFPPALFNEGVIASTIGRRTQAVGAFRAFLAAAPHDAKAADARTALHNLGAQ
jgi:tetratricopeptide (TPR) repeat protein